MKAGARDRIEMDLMPLVLCQMETFGSMLAIASNLKEDGGIEGAGKLDEEGCCKLESAACSARSSCRKSSSSKSMSKSEEIDDMI